MEEKSIKKFKGLILLDKKEFLTSLFVAIILVSFMFIFHVIFTSYNTNSKILSFLQTIAIDDEVKNAIIVWIAKISIVSLIITPILCLLGKNLVLYLLPSEIENIKNK